MPHIILKMHKGRDEETKKRLAEAISTAVVNEAKCPLSAVSIELVDVEPTEWDDTVFAKEILPKMESLAVKPGYNPFEK